MNEKPNNADRDNGQIDCKVIRALHLDIAGEHYRVGDFLPSSNSVKVNKIIEEEENGEYARVKIYLIYTQYERALKPQGYRTEVKLWQKIPSHFCRIEY